MSALDNNTHSTIQSRNHLTSTTQNANSCFLVVYNSRINSGGTRVEYEVKRGRNPRNRGSVTFDEDAPLLVINHFIEGDVFVNSRLEIRSPCMRKAIQRWVQTYPGISFGENVIRLYNPPHCLFHYRHDLLREIQALPEGSVEHGHLEFLHQYIQSQFRNGMQVFQDHDAMPKATSTLDYDNLWMLFRPGCLVYRLDIDGSPIVSRLERFERCACSKSGCPNHNWNLTFLNVDRWGKTYEWHHDSIQLARYEGFRRVNQLDVFPLAYHPDSEGELVKLIERGRKFMSLDRVRYMNYDGIAYSLTANSTLSDLCAVTSHVVIDVEEYARIAPRRKYYGQQCKEKIGQCHNIAGNTGISKVGDGPPTETQDIATCSHVVPGFAISTLTWHYFQVDVLQDIDFDDNTLDKLSITNQYRAQLHLFSQPLAYPSPVNKHAGHCMVLLHGPAGSERYAIVECIANFAKRPLVTIQPGEFGMNPAEFSKRLHQILTTVQRWGTIVFIDKVESYFAEGSSTEPGGNAMVSTLLQHLEDYQGLVVITSAQSAYATVMTVIKPFVSISVPYGSPDFEGRKSLWRQIISNLTIDRDEMLSKEATIAELASYDLDAREVKKIIDTACIIASSRHKSLCFDHLSDAISMAGGSFPDPGMSQHENGAADSGDATPSNKKKRRRK